MRSSPRKSVNFSIAHEQRLASVETRLDRLESILERVLSGIDRLATAIENQKLEWAAITEQLSRHERWLKQISEKTGLKLDD